MEPSEKFVSALRDFIKEEAGQPAAPPPARPSGRTLAVMLAVGVNLALLLLLTEEIWGDSPFVRLITKVLPFLFGATFVALLDDVRHQLLTLCRKPGFERAMFAVLILSGIAAVTSIVAAPVVVRTAHDAELIIDGSVTIPGSDERHTTLVGFKPHTFVAIQNLPDGASGFENVTDTIHVSRWKRLRATALARLIAGPLVLDASNMYRVTIRLEEPLEERTIFRVHAVMSRSARNRVARSGVLAFDSAQVRRRPRVWDDPVESVWFSYALGPDDVAGSFRVPAVHDPYTIEADMGCGSQSRVVRVQAGRNEVPFTACVQQRSEQ